MVRLVGEYVSVDIPEEFNLSDILVDRHLREGRGGNVAFYCFDTGEVVTYKELLKRVCRAGNMLRELGLELGDRIAFIMPDTIEYVELMLGAIRIGVQPILLSTLEQPQFYKFVLNDSVSKTLVVHSSFISNVSDIVDQLKYLRRIIVVGETDAKLSRQQVNYKEFVKNFSDNLPPEVLKRDDFCYWQYSSGTTGPPKGVIHYQQDPLYTAQTYYKHVLGMNEEDINFSVSKIFFSYGLGNTIWGPLYLGASSVLFPAQPQPYQVFETISRFRVTLFYSVPVIYSRLLNWAAAQPVKPKIDSVRYCINAGEALPAPIYHRWKEFFGKEILDGLGTTEMCHIFISNRPGNVKPGSAGRVVPGYEVKLVNEEMEEVPFNTPGRLLVKGNSMAAMYWKRCEKTREQFLGEWFFTGDLCIADEEGFITHISRTDDAIKSGGAFVSPVEIESALYTHPAVLECAVVQAYTQDGIGRPKAYVVLKEGYEPSEVLSNEIKEYVYKILRTGHKVPAWIVFTTELPKTASGKIQRFKLREKMPLKYEVIR